MIYVDKEDYLRKANKIKEIELLQGNRKWRCPKCASLHSPRYGTINTKCSECGFKVKISVGYKEVSYYIPTIESIKDIN